MNTTSAHFKAVLESMIAAIIGCVLGAQFGCLFGLILGWYNQALGVVRFDEDSPWLLCVSGVIAGGLFGSAGGLLGYIAARLSGRRFVAISCGVLGPLIPVTIIGLLDGSNTFTIFRQAWCLWFCAGMFGGGLSAEWSVSRFRSE
jgi:hypothetical protein